MIEEVWKTIPTTLGYEASTEGRIRRPDGFVLAPQRHKRGYRILAVVMADTGKRRSVTVHSLVAAAFLGPRPEGLEIAHGDHDKTNNRPSNLRYATKVENMNDGHPTPLPWDRIEIGESFITHACRDQAELYAARQASRLNRKFSVEKVTARMFRITRLPMLDAITCSATAEIGGAA